jgi:hypothetical protein
MELKEYEDRWSVACTQASVTRVAIDWAVTLTILVGYSGFEVRIEAEFSLTTPDGQNVTLDPEGNPFGLAPVLGLVRHDVTRIDAFKDGRLEIGLTNGGLLSVPAHDDFEPWEIIGQNGMRIVSTPGGELAIWKGDQEATH